MFKKILFGMSALALATACTDDYTDWAAPQTNPAVPAWNIECNIVAAQTETIVLDNVTAETVKVIDVTLPEGITADGYNVKLMADGANYADYNVAADADGFVKTADLQKAATEMFTKESVERVFKAVASTSVNVTAQNGTVAVQVVSDTLTIAIKPITPQFNSYIWEAGVNNNWGAVEQALYSPDGDGKYTGFFYALDADWSGGMGAFKFTGAYNNWDNGNYGAGTCTDEGGTLVDGSESGNLLATPGFYRADVDMSTLTYTLTRINSVYIVGSAVGNDWDNGVAMTYNTSKLCWEADTELSEGVIKFKGNGTWDNIDGNWGGTLDNIVNGSNDNIPVTVTG
ncbi:MAG: hypothetical protein K5928_08935, partial [Prevotella sp.]|nr:hypothetical protein [Prevotella sp.]